MKKPIWTATVVILMTLCVATAVAATSEPWGPDMGSTMPDRLRNLDQDGRQQSFDSLVGQKGLVIVFLRSLDWCRFCKGQAKEIE